MKHQMLINQHKRRIQKLRTERDDLFSILDEVNYEEQTILLESIIDITNKIDSSKKHITRLLK